MLIYLFECLGIAAARELYLRGTFDDLRPRGSYYYVLDAWSDVLLTAAYQPLLFPLELSEYATKVAEIQVCDGRRFDVVTVKPMDWAGETWL